MFSKNAIPKSMDLQQVIAEFRQVSMVTSMVASINSDGRQVIESPEPFITSLERTQPIYRLAMNGLAILLVRNNEVVAVTTHGSTPRCSDADISPPAANLQGLAEQELEPITDFEYAKMKIVGFIVLPNPKRSPELPRMWKDNPEAHYAVMSSGKSSWKAVSQNPWCQM